MEIQTIVKLQSTIKAYLTAYGTRYATMVGKEHKNFPPSDCDITLIPHDEPLIAG